MVQGAVGNAQIACNLRLRFVARSHQLDPFLLKFSCKGSLLLLHDPFPFCGESTLSSLLPPLLWVKTTWLHVGHDGSKWRNIDLMHEARQPLYAYLQARHDSQGIYVFTSQRSERLTEEGIYYWFRTLKAQGSRNQQAVIEDLSFNNLRHDFAYRARVARWLPEEVAYYLGQLTQQGLPALQTMVP